jgi:hypothetical protein
MPVTRKIAFIMLCLLRKFLIWHYF